ncbi:unnamed protein product [Vitrella brassicaformis CCMP3155]|uniref:Uncharacterized protein n=1 Tax=Vitrella brassicaformis (strain CCMP3155) TaxID=1169540 RepID=A0A0G4FVY1_VITBC|nr:unnamed protein product [Vitrella brassicaformis CCMP3155]|mmetsp:Transcript_24498/g.60524  ORF Transcript_24498/g.60524 Transcript_24498/m.60524 type:complete len:374 (-) Transcript_24498:55-1176(-)|eukprot:CEM19052.1 unnamed protein product [Vitrella brassicaformis CCMP3155]
MSSWMRYIYQRLRPGIPLFITRPRTAIATLPAGGTVIVSLANFGFLWPFDSSGQQHKRNVPTLEPRNRDATVPKAVQKREDVVWLAGTRFGVQVTDPAHKAKVLLLLAKSGNWERWEGFLQVYNMGPLADRVIPSDALYFDPSRFDQLPEAVGQLEVLLGGPAVDIDCKGEGKMTLGDGTSYPIQLDNVTDPDPPVRRGTSAHFRCFSQMALFTCLIAGRINANAAQERKTIRISLGPVPFGSPCIRTIRQYLRDWADAYDAKPPKPIKMEVDYPNARARFTYGVESLNPTIVSEMVESFETKTALVRVHIDEVDMCHESMGQTDEVEAFKLQSLVVQSFVRNLQQVAYHPLARHALRYKRNHPYLERFLQWP